MTSSALLLLPLLALVSREVSSEGILFPRESESREVNSLNGVWNFRVAPRDDVEVGFTEEWYLQSLAQTGEVQSMPVPSSFNEITQDASLRDYVGWIWYDREFYVPQRWQDIDQRIFLRFGSVNYFAQVWLNGVSVVEHSGGHLPFVTEISTRVRYNEPNRITVAINNTLTQDTIPQGSLTFLTDTTRYPEGSYNFDYNFDFFHYSGIHRPVYIYTTPVTYIDDVTVTTDVQDGTTGIINYSVEVVGGESYTCNIDVVNKNGSVVASQDGYFGSITVPNATLWWPYLMDPNPGYLYTLKIQVVTPSGTDIYRQPVGIRKISWTESEFLINNRPFYFRGFGRHEDSDIRGKGFDLPLAIKDHNLLKWLGANSYRTSHYPYSEELMERADADGIVIIDECPAVAIHGFQSNLLTNHIAQMETLIQRDKNRPSVVLWSIANEPTSQEDAAGPYFSSVINFTKTMDPSRPTILVVNQGYNTDKGAQYADIIGVNRYYGWYSDTGRLEVIQRQVENDINNWIETHNKPVLITEYGADTVAGMHTDPEFIFTEDYQVAFLQEYFKAFDNLRQRGNFIGEMIWNFADFTTNQDITRVVGNKKGIFTRQRQPKAAARLVRSRYLSLAGILDNATDLQEEKPYVCRR